MSMVPRTSFRLWPRLPQKMLGSVVTMVMGLGITFLILILIWIFIAIMGRVLGATGKPKEKPAAPAAAPAAAAPAAAAPVKSAPAAASNDELIAVITAAIAASEGNVSAGNLIVRKITRLSGELTPWANAANEERMATRKF